MYVMVCVPPQAIEIEKAAEGVCVCPNKFAQSLLLTQ